MDTTAVVSLHNILSQEEIVSFHLSVGRRNQTVAEVLSATIKQQLDLPIKSEVSDTGDHALKGRYPFYDGTKHLRKS